MFFQLQFSSGFCLCSWVQDWNPQ